MKEKLKLPVKIIIHEIEYDLPYVEELKLSTSTINEDIAEQASRYAWYAVLSEKAKGYVNDLKLDLGNMDALLSEQHRARLTVSGDKFTEKKIADLVGKDEDRLVLVVKLNATTMAYGQLTAIVRAFDHRKEMISALASNMRKELDTKSSFYKGQVKDELEGKENKK